jgi:hypothetical protein
MGKIGKLYVFLSLLICRTTLFSAQLTAQEVLLDLRFSFHFTNTPLDSVIESFRKEVSCGFSYNPDYFPNNRKIEANFHQEKLKVILDSVLSQVNLSYKVIDNNIVILPVKSMEENRKEKAIPEETDTAKIIQLCGQITDPENQPIGYASIYIHNKNTGTLSNDDGNFIIKIPSESINDSLFVSCIGYKTERKKIIELQKSKNIITLSMIPFQLKEIRIKPVKPEEIVKKMVDLVPKNYSPVPLGLTAFYRETVQQNGQYVGLSEAILKIYKAPYIGFINDQVKIYKGRKSSFDKQMDTITFKFQGGIYTSLMLDIAKNPSNFISDEYLSYYNFGLDDIIPLQGRPTYVLSFDQKDNMPYPLFKGRLYIDVETYAMVRADFMISPKGIDHAAEVLVRKSPRKLNVKPTYSSYIVNYKRQKNTWYLNDIREEIEFKVKKKLSFHQMIFRSKAEMVITKTDSINVQRFKLNQVVRSSDIFVEKIGAYDPEFWGNFNIIKPDESLEDALKKIKARTK